MKRRKFIEVCCFGALGLPVASSVLHSCGAIYFANSTPSPSNAILKNSLKIAKSEFWKIKKNGKKSNRSFVLLKPNNTQFPICLYKIEENHYVASLLECSHRSCELNVGGGIFSCPCHGSEFSITGKVLEGPAQTDLKTFKTATDKENVYVAIS